MSNSKLLSSIVAVSRMQGILGALCLAVVCLCLFSAQQAQANSSGFCEGVELNVGHEDCHSTFVSNIEDVVVHSGAHSACASALSNNNGNPGVEVGGTVCSSGPHTTAVNSNYNGKVQLFAWLKNNVTGSNVVSGEVVFP